MKTGIEIDFLDHFKTLEDPRSSRNRLYTMAEILLVTLCSAICGAEGWEDVEIFGKLKIDYLRTILPYKNGTPSDDTVRRFFRALAPEKFQELFRSWVESLEPLLNEKQIAIDGKSSRHSFDGDDEKMLHMISAYATETRLVLAQEKVSDKSNEITAIPKLLEYLDLKGTIVTIDAMGCQYAIADKITEREGSYVFSLKGNQSNLREDVATYLSNEELKSVKEIKFFEDHDKGHGRVETRQCWVSENIEWLRQRHPQWGSIVSIIRIDSTRQIKDKISKETRYYISSLKADAKKILAAVRSHWSIENNLHWVLDMSFGEDQSRIRKHNAPQIMAIIRHIALNLLQLMKNKMKRQSIKRLRKAAGWDNQTLSSILAQKFS